MQWYPFQVRTPTSVVSSEVAVNSNAAVAASSVSDQILRYFVTRSG